MVVVLYTSIQQFKKNTEVQPYRHYLFMLFVRDDAKLLQPAIILVTRGECDHNFSNKV